MLTPTFQPHWFCKPDFSTFSGGREVRCLHRLKRALRRPSEPLRAAPGPPDRAAALRGRLAAGRPRAPQPAAARRRSLRTPSAGSCAACAPTLRRHRRLVVMGA